MLRDAFGIAEWQKSHIMIRIYININKDSASVNSSGGVENVETVIRTKHCYVPHYSPNVEPQVKPTKQIWNTAPLE